MGNPVLPVIIQIPLDKSMTLTLVVIYLHVPVDWLISLCEHPLKRIAIPVTRRSCSPKYVQQEFPVRTLFVSTPRILRSSWWMAVNERWFPPEASRPITQRKVNGGVLQVNEKHGSWNLTTLQRKTNPDTPEISLPSLKHEIAYCAEPIIMMSCPCSGNALLVAVPPASNGFRMRYLIINQWLVTSTITRDEA